VAADAGEVDTAVTTGPIEIAGGANVDVSGEGGGSVVIRAGRFELRDAQIVAATTGARDGGTIDIAVDSFAARDGARVQSDTTGSGRGANVHIAARESVSIGGHTAERDSRVVASTHGVGDAGDIGVDVPALIMDEGKIESSSSSGASGNAGNVDVEATTVNLSNDGQIFSRTDGEGAAGHVTVSASDSLSIVGINLDDACGIFIETYGRGNGGDVIVSSPVVNVEIGVISASTEGQGRTGDITIQAGDVRVTNTGAIQNFTCGPGDAGAVFLTVGTLTIDTASIATPSEGSGRGGTIRIVASEGVFLSGESSSGQRGGIGSDAYGAGDAGDVFISTPLLQLDGGVIETVSAAEGRGGDIILEVGELRLVGGLINSSTNASGDGGDITVNATDSITLVGRGLGGVTFGFAAGTTASGRSGAISITSPTLVLDEGAIILTRSLSGEDAGDVTVNVGALHLLRGSVIDSSTLGEGAGGTITITASESVVAQGRDIDGTPSRISSATAGGGGGGRILIGAPSVVFDDAVVSTTSLRDGGAGDITLNIDTLSISNGTVIDTSTVRAGAGGALIINATESLTLTGPETALRSSASGTGQAGEIAVAARDIALSDGASIAATSSGAADAGNIALTARHRFESSGASVTTAANAAEGGNIVISASDLRLEDQSEVTASVAGGEGGGGDVSLTAKTVVALNDSDITANADRGPGGNITVQAEAFFNSPDSTLSASSNTGIEGTVQVNAPESNLVTSLVPLPAEFLRADEILAERCAARAGEASTFVLGGRRGVPPAPDAGVPERSTEGNGSL
jgi:large exoprotein involved in heme utilization and adhesion